MIRRRFNWQQQEEQPADAGRGRPDHRRDQGARPPDPEQGPGQDPEVMEDGVLRVKPRTQAEIEAAVAEAQPARESAD